MPAWPHLIHSHPADAYRAFQDCLAWLDATANAAPGTACVLCGRDDPNRALGLCIRCYRRATRVEDYLFLRSTGDCEEMALARIASRDRRGCTLRAVDRAITDLRAHPIPALPEQVAALWVPRPEGQPS